MPRTVQPRARGAHLYARRYPSGLWWYIYVSETDRRSTGTQDRAEAERQLAAVLRSDPAAAGPGPRPETPLTDLARAYCAAPHGWTPRTARSTALRVTAFVEAMAAAGATMPAAITPEALDAWRTARGKQVSRATINRDETAARGFLAWAVERGLAHASPFARREPVREPRRPRGRTVHSPAQVARMVAWGAGNGHRGWALTAAVLEATGLRVEEARRMTADWITPEGLRLTPEAGAAAAAWTSKGYRPRLISLATEALDVVREWLRWREKGAGRKGKAPGLSGGWFAGVADLAAAACGLPATYRPHDARRRWVTELVRGGVPISRVRELVGHRDVATTEGYVCGYYDDPAAVTVATPSAVAALAGVPATVLPMRRRGKRG